MFPALRRPDGVLESGGCVEETYWISQQLSGVRTVYWRPDGFLASGLPMGFLVFWDSALLIFRSLLFSSRTLFYGFHLGLISGLDYTMLDIWLKLVQSIHIYFVVPCTNYE